MKKLTLTLVAIIMASNAFSIVEADWKTSIEGKPESIYFHNFTQTPVVETSKNYYGLAPEDQKIIWTIQKSEKMKALQKARTASALAASSDVTAGMDLQQYYEIPFTQFANINNNIIDVTTGKILVGEENNPFKSFISDDIIPELNLLLIEVKDEDNSKKLYGIDIAKNEVLWSTKLADANAAKDALNFIAKANGIGQFQIDLFKPSVTEKNNIIYNNNGKLSLINSQSGEIMWENDCNPGTFSLSPDQSTILVAQKPSGLGLMGKSSPFGKEILAIDAVNGTNLWEEPVKLGSNYAMNLFLNPEKVLIANEDGINLYDTKSGEENWRRDFNAKNLKSMTLTNEGLEVQYGAELTVIDPKTGEEVWKKPVKLKGLDDKAEYEPIKKEYQKTFAMVTPSEVFVYEKESGKDKWSEKFDKDAKIGFDKKNGNILVISNKTIYLFNPDQQNKAPKPVKIKIENPDEIAGFEVNSNGYFIYGQKEYILLNKKGEVTKHEVFNQLKSDRLANAGLLAATITSGAMSSRGTITSSDGSQAEFGVFVDPETAKAFEESSIAMNDLRKNIRDNNKERAAVKTDQNYAYFVKSEKVNDSDLVSIVMVDKKTGEKANTIDFSKDRNVVYEIDFNSGNLYYVDNGEFKTVAL
jgi:outer membrane protein assembly factor BamB